MLAEVTAWQTRPLEPVYPILYLDALVVKVKDSHQVRNKAAHLAVGVDTDGIKHVLGIWVQTSEGAKFWAGVLAELRNRGVKDVLIACCDGVTGFPEAIEATWPQTVVQTSSVHHGGGGMVPPVTRAVSVRTCANGLPSRSRCRPVRPGRWRALHLPHHQVDVLGHRLTGLGPARIFGRGFPATTCRSSPPLQRGLHQVVESNAGLGRVTITAIGGTGVSMVSLLFGPNLLQRRERIGAGSLLGCPCPLLLDDQLWLTELLVWVETRGGAHPLPRRPGRMVRHRPVS